MMAWAKLDDDYPDHPKILAAGPLAAWLNTCGICYCSRMLTDGFVPDGQVRRLADVDDPECLAARLVEVRLWERVPGGYRIHDYLDYNPTREHVETVRTARAEAGREGGKRSGEVRASKPEANCLNGASPVASSMYEAKTNPVPLPLPGSPSPSPTPTQNTAEVTRGVRRRTSPASPNPANVATWEAYRAAYFAAYRVEPVRNGSVNGQVAKLVQRLGAEEAPKVAAWFVGHRGAWYVQQGHSVGALLRDCEKLHTEMCAGVRIHRRDVDEIDRGGADAALIARLDARHQERMRGNDAG